MLCSLCHTEIVDTNYIKQGKKRYHKECFDKLQNNAEIKDKQKVGELKSDEKQSLDQYIMQLYHISKIPFAIERQIEEYVEKYNFSYSGIEKSLYYFYVIQKHDFDITKKKIGIVQYIYDETKKYFLDIYQVKELNKGKDINETINTIKIVPPDKNIKCNINITYIISNFTNLIKVHRVKFITI